MSQKSYSRPVQSSEFHVFKIVCSNVFVYNVPTFMKFDKTLDSNPIIYIYRVCTVANCNVYAMHMMQCNKIQTCDACTFMC